MKIGEKVRILAKNCDLLGRAIQDRDEVCVVEKVGTVSSELRSQSGWEYLLFNSELEPLDTKS